MADATSFLVINVSRIGDTLFSTPSIRAIANAYPDASITVLAHPNRAEVLEHLPFVRRLGTITKKRARWRGWLPGRRYDYALVYGFDKPLVAYALRVARRVVAFCQNDARLDDRLFRAVPVPPFQSEHAVRHHLRLPAALDIAPTGLRIAYRVTETEHDWARVKLARDVAQGARPLIGLQVASFHTKAFRDWPIEKFADTARRIVSEWPNAHFLIFGGRDERDRTMWLAGQLGARATHYAGSLTLRQTAAIMSHTDLYIGVDTGPTHIMSAFDIPLVGLYHCNSPAAHTGPLEHPCLYVVDHPRPHPCKSETPMAEISVDLVFDAVRRALSPARRE